MQRVSQMRAGIDRHITPVTQSKELHLPHRSYSLKAGEFVTRSLLQIAVYDKRQEAHRIMGDNAGALMKERVPALYQELHQHFIHNNCIAPFRNQLVP